MEEKLERWRAEGGCYSCLGEESTRDLGIRVEGGWSAESMGRRRGTESVW